MKIIKINYVPPLAMTLIGGFVVAAMISCIVGRLAIGTDFSEKGFAIAIIGMVLLVLALLLFDGSYIQFGCGDIINCRWRALKWKIDLSRIDRVAYNTKSCRNKNGEFYELNIVFIRDRKIGRKKKCLSDKLDSAGTEMLKLGKTKDIPLMQLYDYIESIHPEMAVGYSEMM